MFATGAVLLFRAARNGGERIDDAAGLVTTSPRAAAIGSFGLVVLAEWGDLTQLATAGLAARRFAALGGARRCWRSRPVAALAATFGRQIVARVPVNKINYVAAAVFAALAIWTVVELFV